MATNGRPIERPWLIAITDPDGFGGWRTLNMVQRLCSLARPGTVLVQLRSEALTMRDRYQLGLSLRSVCERSEQALCINDRLDLALALKVSHAHLKETSLHVDDTRLLMSMQSGKSWISQAWHPGSEPPSEGADALIVSPAMLTRKGRPALGLERLRQLAQVQSTPLYALGGVTAESVQALLEAGMAGIAAVGECYHHDRELVAGLGIER